MAAVEMADFATTVRNNFRTKVTDGIFEATPLWAEIRRRRPNAKGVNEMFGGDGGLITGEGGDQIKWPVMYARMPSSGFGAGTEVSVSSPEVLKQGVLGWAGKRVGYFISKWTEMSMHGPEHFVPLIRFYEKASIEEFETLFEEMALQDGSSGSPPTWTGLPAFVTNTGTYATNIDLTATWGTPGYHDCSASGKSWATSALELFTEVWNEATHGRANDSGSSGPSLAYLNKTRWQELHNLMLATTQYVDVDTEMHSRGFVHMRFNGINIYWVSAMGSSNLNIQKCYLLNPSYLGVMTPTPNVVVPLEFPQYLGEVGRGYIWLHKGQMFCSSTNRQGVIDNINN